MPDLSDDLSKHSLIFTLFTQGLFGLRELSWPVSVCVCAYLCVCQLLLVRVITHHMFQLESPDLDEKMQNILLKVPIVLGAVWAWPSMSNLTSFKYSVYLHRFCVFEIFVRLAKNGVCWTIPHPTWRRTHSDSFICTRTRSCHGPWNSLETNLRETIGVLPALESAIGSGFYKLLSVFAKLYAPHIPIFYITILAIIETIVKQRSFAFIYLALTLSDQPYF